MIEITQFYMLNEDFKKFVDKFRIAHRTTLEGALKCIAVKAEYKKLKKKQIDLL